MAVSAAVDSLLLADRFELLGGPGGYPIPASAGGQAGVYVKLNFGYDLSSPQTTVSLVAALSGDGERPYGRRASNRTITLPLIIDASQISGQTLSQQFSALASVLEDMMYLLDADLWRLVWTRRQGLDPHQMPLVFDCFRARPAQVTYGGADGTLGYAVAQVTLTFDALPYGRDDVPQIVDFQNSIREGTAPPAAQLLDQFSNNYLSVAGGDEFENGTIGNWVGQTNCSVANTRAVAHLGAGALAITCTLTGTAPVALSDNTPLSVQNLVAPGDQVYASAWVLTAVTGRAVQLGVQWWTSGGATLSQTLGPSVTDNTTTWQQLQFTAVAPATAAFASLLLTYPSATGTGEVHYADTCVLSDLSSGFVTGGTGWGFQASGPNTGYSAYWDPSEIGLGSPNFAWQVGIIADGSTANPGAVSPQVALSAYKSYVLDFWALASVTAITMLVQVNWYNSGHSLISTTTVQTTTVQNNTIPVHIRASAPAPGSAAFASFQIEMSGTPANGVTLYLAAGTAAGNGLTNTTGSFSNVNIGPAFVENFVPGWTNAPGGTTGDYSGFATGQNFGAPTFSRFIPDVNMTGLTSVTFWAGFGSTLHYPMWAKKGGTVRFVLTLFDTSGATLSVTRLQTCLGSDDATRPRWQKVRIQLPHSTTFNWADVVKYQLVATNRGDEMWFTRFWLSDVRAQPPSEIAVAQPNAGTFYEFAEIAGEARAQLSLRVETGATHSYTRSWTTPGAANWVAPPGVTSLATLLVTGPGGAGSFTGGGGAGGAGGSSFDATSVAVTPGKSYPLYVGKPAVFTYIGQPPILRAYFDPIPSSFTADAGIARAPGGLNASGATGGSAAAAGSATGSLSGSGFTGGAGGSFGSAPGGGGSSGGSAANGNAGTNAGVGGAAVTGGGAGAAGRTGAGSNGGAPGGGGGGGTTAAGAGSAGQVQLSYTGPGTFQSLLVHRPGFSAPPELVPFVPIPVTDTPNGSTVYEVPDAALGLNARFNGTYSVVVCPFHWDSPSTVHTITVTVTQYESTGGASYTASVSQPITPNNLISLSGTPSGTGFAFLGEITLPPNPQLPDNLDSWFGVSITSSDTSDRFQDVLFLDTMGSSVIIQSPTAYASMWIDEPSVDQDIGWVLGSVFDRDTAVSIMDRADYSGPPLDIDPYGSRSLLVYQLEATPAVPPLVQGYYFPRHFLERVIQ